MKKKLRYNKRLDQSIYDKICLEIDKLRIDGYSFVNIKNILRQRYPDYNDGTLIIKYYEGKDKQ